MQPRSTRNIEIWRQSIINAIDAHNIAALKETFEAKPDLPINLERIWKRAIHSNNLSVIKFFLSKNLDINMSNGYAIYESVYRGNITMFSFFIKSGANIFINLPENISVAVQRRHFNILDIYLEQGIPLQTISENAKKYMRKELGVFDSNTYQLFDRWFLEKEHSLLKKATKFNTQIANKIRL